jgi:hypothetical protein
MNKFYGAALSKLHKLIKRAKKQPGILWPSVSSIYPTRPMHHHIRDEFRNRSVVSATAASNGRGRLKSDSRPMLGPASCPFSRQDPSAAHQKLGLHTELVMR